jgi:hypothetical protein
VDHGQPKHSSNPAATKGTRAPPAEQTKVYAILGKLSDAISFVATAANALQGAEERSRSVNAEEINDEIITLSHGVACLRAAHDEMDVALRQFADEESE